MCSSDLDFLKFFSSAVGFGTVIFGYSYSQTFFRSFGLNLHQLDMSWIDIVFRGLALLENSIVLFFFALVAVVVSLVWAFRKRYGEVFAMVFSTIAILGLLMSAIVGGKQIGIEHARAIWGGGAGKPAFCRIADGGANSKLSALSTALDKLSSEQRIRMILITKEFTYLAPVLKSVPVGQETGESYAIPTTSIVYCRIVGS